MGGPDIGFAVEHDGGRVLDVQGGQDRLARVAALTSRDLATNGIGVDLDRGEMHLRGVISLPTFNRGIADHQYLFVTGRPVKDRLLVGALSGAYAELLARDRPQVVALLFDLAPSQVHVNVPPAKTPESFPDS